MTEIHLSQMAGRLVGSEILKIAGQVRARQARGESVVNLTVGDFKASQFPIPDVLRDGICDAYRAGETNYPPSNGLPELREAVVAFYSERLGLDYPVESVIVMGGVRPAIYGTYRTLLDPGEKLIYPVPSWNNNHYAWLVGAQGVPVTARRETNFLPTADDLAPYIRSARVLTLNSPLNPAGTAYSESEMEGIVRLVRNENTRRAASGERPVMLLYDHVYWMLTFGSVKHVTPVQIDPAMREFTIFTDGISKSFAATGVRVGWCVGPAGYMKPMSDILGHVGAWAPRAEQVATTKLLKNGAAIESYHAVMKKAVEDRLTALYAGFESMRKDGYAVESIEPQGAIYLSTRFNIIGRSSAGGVLDTNEKIREFLLSEASVAVVPFQAFGLKEESGWFRLSVGAVSMGDIAAMFPALRKAMDGVSGQ